MVLCQCPITLGFLFSQYLTWGEVRENLYKNWPQYTLVALATLLIGCGILLVSLQGPRAELEKLSNKEMRDVSGQSLLEFEDFSGNEFSGVSNNVCGDGGNDCLHFARIQMDVEGTINAGVEDTRLGLYDDSGGLGNSIYQPGCSNGPAGCRSNPDDADIDAPALELLDATLERPYVELAYRDWSSDKELVGLRVGGERIDGTVNFSLNTLSGSFAAEANPFGLTAEFYGHRNQQACVNVGIEYCTDPGLADGVTFNNTEDFWISVNKQDIMWQRNNPAITPTNGVNEGDNDWHTDGKGFWVHASDNINAEDVFL